MRTRRDHARFLNLIEVSAFLHQHQRERTREGAIVAAVADYAVAYALAAEVLGETLYGPARSRCVRRYSASGPRPRERARTRLAARDPRGAGPCPTPP